ncbi:unnamed protein product [Clavelina lepadiformis]|uniref:LIM zinc-binding domain-containing protein n=1 Tax=Clavelina lepadiformis TaxID=159417 RepID=A0ABP0GH53_CLALP
MTGENGNSYSNGDVRDVAKEKIMNSSAPLSILPSETKIVLSPLITKGRGPSGVVTIVSLRMCGLDELWNKCSQTVVSSVLLEYREIVDRCVKDFHGFEVSSYEDQFLIVFQKPWDALNCCLTMQSALAQTVWPNDVLACQSCVKVEEKNVHAGRTVVFNGPRVQVGVTRGKVHSEYEYSSGNTKYSGTELDLAVGIARIAKGGQILVNTTAWTEIQRSQLTPCIHNDTGRQKVDGSEKRVRLVELLPAALSERSKWFGTCCSNCGDRIRPDQGYIKALGRHWHLKHFRCCHCNDPLMDSYIVKDGMPYCLDDFFTLHARTCHGCDTIITGSYIEAMSNYWHPDCFVCQKCRRPPEGSENIYEFNALPFCLKCYHEVASTMNSARTKSQNKVMRSDDIPKHHAVVKS